ncbi:hypothetical protein [Rickettsia hoogstraalii]|nr:hypothetical protein [Rickettsia hoogstraalii]
MREELRSNSTKQSCAKVLRLPRSFQSLAMTWWYPYNKTKNTSE